MDIQGIGKIEFDDRFYRPNRINMEIPYDVDDAVRHHEEMGGAKIGGRSVLNAKIKELMRLLEAERKRSARWKGAAKKYFERLQLKAAD